MARSYAKILASIWRDADFLALTESAQRTYWLIMSQPQITNCGIVPYTPKRWAGFAADSSPDAILTSVDELVRHRFVVADEATEEIWVRSFIRHDGVMGTSQLRNAMFREVNEIVSANIRRHIHEALAHLVETNEFGHEISQHIARYFDNTHSEQDKDPSTDRSRTCPPTGPEPVPDMSGDVAHVSARRPGARAPSPFLATSNLQPAALSPPVGVARTAGGKLDPDAQELVNDWWDAAKARTGQPPTHQNYTRIVKDVAKLLRSWPAKAVRIALDDADTYTIPALELALNRQKRPAGKADPREQIGRVLGLSGRNGAAIDTTGGASA